jgi:cytochrome c biogenesis protein CcmG, thiol:disulfide interchange protein DsbE
LRRPALRWSIVAATLALPVAGTAARRDAPVPAPAIELQGPQGNPVRVSDFRGKVVLVDFWASWCGPCKLSFPALDALYRKRHAEGLEVLAIDVDEDRRQGDEFLKGRPHEMLVLFDPEGRAPAAFHVEAMPSSYLVDRRGRIRFKHVGYTTAVDAAYEREVNELLSEEVP